ncbi:Ref family recombination enhancement nuclease [Tropicimonas sp. IMCC34011]|uniref:Ref family recombination enhancement nuclease n=1 Tax=Tropicimonas sp. IMCC34011 TaxID=2248759 RepID=UPI000E27E0E8|nr:Ref family recombination enhancement nuclease [Tropicimonas sp. IMCC34011]
MKRSPLARRTPLTSTSQMERTGKIRPVSKRRQKARQSAEGKAGQEHMARVAALPCVICVEWGMVQQSRTTVHHCIHGRYSRRRAPDTMTLPLCEGHHTGDLDTSKLALHREPAAWKSLYGSDTDWLSWVEQRLGIDR